MKQICMICGKNLADLSKFKGRALVRIIGEKEDGAQAIPRAVHRTVPWLFERPQMRLPGI